MFADHNQTRHNGSDEETDGGTFLTTRFVRTAIDLLVSAIFRTGNSFNYKILTTFYVDNLFNKYLVQYFNMLFIHFDNTK